MKPSMRFLVPVAALVLCVAGYTAVRTNADVLASLGLGGEHFAASALTPIPLGTPNPYYPDIAPRTMFPSKTALLPAGVTYTDTVPATLDLAQRAAAFIPGAIQAVDTGEYNAPAVGLFNSSSLHGEYASECSSVPCLEGNPNVWGKIMLALQQAREMSGYDRTDAHHTLAAQHTMLSNMLDYGVAYNTILKGGYGIVVGPLGSHWPTVSTVAMESIIPYATGYSGSDAVRAAVEDFVQLHANHVQTVVDNGVSYGLFATSTALEETEIGTLGHYSWPAFINGRAAYALLWWHEVSGSQAAYTLAQKLIDSMLSYKGGIFSTTPNPSKYPSEPGVFVGHIHSQLWGVFALLQDAKLRLAKNPNDAKAKDEIAKARQTYEFVKKLSRAGYTGNISSSGTTGDMVRAAIMLTQLGAGMYYDDVEYWTRNHLSELQIDSAKAAYIPNYSTGIYETSRVGTKVQGMFFSDATHLFAIPQNRNFWYNVDDSANAFRAIYDVWKHTLTFKGPTVTVNFLLNHANKYLTVKSDLPYQGKVEVAMMQDIGPLTTLGVRIPGWANPAAVTVTATDQNGAKKTIQKGTGGWELLYGYAFIHAIEPNMRYTVSFPIVVHTAPIYELRSPDQLWYEGSFPASGRENIRTYTGTFRGYELVKATPAASYTGVPLYAGRSALASLPAKDVAPPTVTLERFVVGGSQQSIPLPLPAAAKPDLIAEKGAAVAAAIGQSVSYSGSIRNIGEGTAEGAFMSVLQICNTDITWCNAALPTASHRDLLPGTSAPVSASFTFATNGSYQYRFCADVDTAWKGSIAESNDSNNCAAWAPITIGNVPTKPAVTPIPLPDAPAPDARCESGWTLVPGNPALGTSDFCVMKFEAQNPRQDLFSVRPRTTGEPAEPEHIVNPEYVAQKPTSRTGAVPWVYVTQQQAAAACSRIGGGAHLITMKEAQTISRNIMLQPLNWASNHVGQGCMYGGHLDLHPSNVLAAPTSESGTAAQYQFTNDSITRNPDGGVAGACFARGNLATGEVKSNGYLSRRAMVLSTGQLIWDWAGNAWEWIADTANNNALGAGNSYVWTNQSNGNGYFDYNPSDHPNSGDPTRPAPLYTEWTKWYLQDYESNVMGPRIATVAGTQLLDSRHGVGMYFGPMRNGYAIYRGGGAYHGHEGGIFQTHMSHSTVFNHPYGGFRCAMPADAHETPTPPPQQPQDPTPPTPAPAITLTVNGSGTTVSMPQGTTYTLSWGSSNVTSCAASTYSYNGITRPWTVGTNGQWTFSTIFGFDTFTYTLSCTGENGQQVSKSVTIIRQ